MEEILLSVQRKRTDVWDLRLTAQELVEYATDAGIDEPMPRHGETTRQWFERLMESYDVLARTVIADRTRCGAASNTEEEFDVLDGYSGPLTYTRV